MKNRLAEFFAQVAEGVGEMLGLLGAMFESLQDWAEQKRKKVEAGEVSYEERAVISMFILFALVVSSGFVVILLTEGSACILSLVVAMFVAYVLGEEIDEDQELKDKR